GSPVWGDASRPGAGLASCLVVPAHAWRTSPGGLAHGTFTTKGTSMSTLEGDPMATRRGDSRSMQEEESVRGLGSAWFVGTLLLIVGMLNLFYGIAAVANSSFYAAGERYVFGSLHTWGWITIILAVIQLTGALS